MSSAIKEALPGRPDCICSDGLPRIAQEAVLQNYRNKCSVDIASLYTVEAANSSTLCEMLEKHSGFGAQFHQN